MTPRTDDARSGGTAPRTELAGLKVADFSTVMAGPYCTRLLADLGADVVKVEAPTGDHIRSATPLRDGHSAYFAQLNAGKRALGLDLRSDGGRRAARALIDDADIVVENFRPGVMARFGLDYATVAEANPKVVYCSISGYGQEGPWVDRPAVAQVVHAVSGFDTALVSYQMEPMAPLSAGLFVADALAGSLAFGGVLAALRARDTTGVGRQVDIALLDGILSLMPYEVATGQFPQGYDRKGYPPARTSDGYVMVAAVNERNFRALATVIDRSDLLDDERFNTTGSRWQHTAELLEILEGWTSTRTAAQVEEAMLAGGVPASRYQTVADQLDSEQLRQRGTFVEVEDGAGALRAVRPLHFRGPGEAFGEKAAERPQRVPDLGGDTRDVLTELLGPDEAARLISEGNAFEARAAAGGARRPGGEGR